MNNTTTEENTATESADSAQRKIRKV